MKNAFKTMKEKTYLHVAFCDIQRCDTGVGEATGDSTTEHALGIIGSIMRDRAGEPGWIRLAGFVILKQEDLPGVPLGGDLGHDIETTKV
jgi:hypothetical protein